MPDRFGSIEIVARSYARCMEYRFIGHVRTAKAPRFDNRIGVI